MHDSQNRPIVVHFSEEYALSTFKQSLDDIVSCVGSAVRTCFATQTDSWPWVRSVYSDTVIYTVDDETVSRAWYFDENDKVAFGEDTVPMMNAWIPKPAPKTSFSDEEMVIKEARIFEAGNYPDKGAAYTEDDLQTIADNFEPCEMKIQHVDTAFDGFIGTVQKVWRKGKELWAQLALPAPAAAFAEYAGAKKLSVSINSALKKITEISLVKKGRVASAQMFADGIHNFDEAESPFQNAGLSGVQSASFASTLTDLVYGRYQHTKEVTLKMPDEKKVDAPVAGPTMEQYSAQQDKIALLEFALKKRDADSTIEAAIKAGKIAPAAREFAEAILLGGSNEIKFSDTETITVGQAFEKFLEANAKVVDFTESAKGLDSRKFRDGQQEEGETKFSADTLAMAKELGVDPKDLQKYGNWMGEGIPESPEETA